ncbi:MAG: NAD(P)H-dependent glycerol-3-phosphate dehydrogenase [Verrucomicrobiota bacterium]|nr:NAD(P)-dependent glycerol-3-phosphate dehydrogenase [Limisphaera sp.]MDW8382017.1 NAD(P)H-dependent glycerol-3-phosphate dehydrogenase [Verrucomicrobiota bacterium]
MKISILGAGAWGTALARLLADRGHTVTLWDYFAATLEGIARTGRNDRYLPGVPLPPGLILEPDAARAVQGVDLVIVASVSRAFRSVTACLGDFTGVVVTVTKGIEFETGLTMSGVLHETAPRARVVALSGPSLAWEVARGVPTAVVVASEDAEAARLVQGLFHGPVLRVYTSTDLRGVELGGALKNVFAIGAGVCDGLGFGDNSKAALVTRAIAEMRRLGVACGARAETFAGLSGIGDLMVTCFSPLSRNRQFGERLGRGESVEQILNTMTAVAEGYPTARAAFALARRLEVETPIIDEVHAMLYAGKDVRRAVQDLLARESKPED